MYVDDNLNILLLLSDNFLQTVPSYVQNRQKHQWELNIKYGHVVPVQYHIDCSVLVAHLTTRLTEMLYDSV